MSKIIEKNLNFTNSSPTPPITPGLRRSKWAMPVMPNVFSLFPVSGYFRFPIYNSQLCNSTTPRLLTLQMEGGQTAYAQYTLKNEGLVSITNPDTKTINFTYDSLGRRTKLSLPNGTETTYAYDNVYSKAEMTQFKKENKDDKA